MENNFEKELVNILQGDMEIPDKVRKSLDNTYNMIKKKRKYSSRVLIRRGAVAALIGITLFGAAAPSYAKNLPILQSVLNHFGIGSGYNKIINEFGVSNENSGVRITINSAIYDGYELLVSYTAESNKPMKEKPFVNTKALIYEGSTKGITSFFKAKSNVSFSSEYGEFTDNNKKTYSGAIEFKAAENNFDLNEKSKSIKEKVIDKLQIGSHKIPDKFTLDLSIDKFGDAQGKWNFNLAVESEKAKGNIKEITVNKDLSKLFPKTKLEKVIVTPIRTYLQGTVSNDNTFFDYIVVNDKNDVLKHLGGETVQYDKDGRYIGSFDTASMDNKTITIIPYNYYQGKKNSGVPLNLNGETKISLGSNKQLIITKAEEKEGKTYIYYKTQFPVNELLPFHLVDDQGVEYMKHEYMPIAGEDVLVYDELLLNKSLKVVNNTTVFYDDSFTVAIK